MLALTTLATLACPPIGCAAPWRSPVTVSLNAPPEASAQLPGEIRDGWIIVEAAVNGRAPLRFILDTGANFSAITSDGAKAAGIQPDQTANITDISGDRRDYPFGWADEVQAGPLLLHRVPFVVTDNLADLKAQLDVAGILGYPGFDQLTLDIDYPAGVARVTNAPITPDQPGAVPLRRIGHETPEIQIQLLDHRDRTIDTRWFSVDTGGLAWLHLPDTMQSWTHHDLGVPIGWGRGLSGITSTNDIAPMRGPIRIGRVVVDHAVAETDNHHTLIGHQLLRLFRVRLDPRSSLAALTLPEPASTRTAAPRHAGIGVNLSILADDTINILSIRADSPAAHAGLRPNDRVLAVDGVPAGDPDFIDRTAWHAHAPPEVTLTIRRDDAVFEVTVPTEPLFPDDLDRLRNAGPDLQPPPIRVITNPDGTRDAITPDGVRSRIEVIAPRPSDK